MFNQYETVFIVTPVLSEPQVKEAVIKFRDLIVSNGGEMINEENWGLKKLAYPIQKKSTGFFNLFEFNLSPELVGKIELELKRDERVIRFLTVSQDKHSAAYAEKRRKRLKSAKEE